MVLFPAGSGILSAVFALNAIETLFLQGSFMLASLVIPLIFVVTKKWKWSEIGFSEIDAGSWKKAAYFLPLLAIFVPAAWGGFEVSSAAYILGNLYLYLSVGIAEEVYFRGVIPKCLSRAFPLKSVIVLSAVIFGIGHIAAAFTASSGLEVLLTVINAVIFGWLAIEMTVICHNITPGILLHFLFDFETKIVRINGVELLTAEWLRGGIMVVAAVWLAARLKAKISDSKYREITND